MTADMADERDPRLTNLTHELLPYEQEILQAAILCSRLPFPANVRVELVEQERPEDATAGIARIVPADQDARARDVVIAQPVLLEPEMVFRHREPRLVGSVRRFPDAFHNLDLPF